MAEQEQITDTKMDVNNLYREETITDQRVGTIRVFTPVNKDGDPDTSRPVEYVGQAHVMTPAGTLPLTFKIEAG
ncbi:MAG: hypothetical protein MJA83_15330, partial [Gammaproteobacteria bacterium]|nr:hypothetical protein [Gammaproteobacteria bacterium]